MTAVRNEYTDLSTGFVSNQALETGCRGRAGRNLLHVFAFLALFGLHQTVAAGGEDTGQQAPELAKFLHMEAVLDGRCQILSARGKLMTMRNTHETRPIKFRLIRYFADTPQAGRVIGRLDAGTEPMKLGCTRVDGREQRWEVLIAEFDDEKTDE